jgi:CheY-like chemotaxis protein
MIVLIVEDDHNKSSQLTQVVEGFFPQCEIAYARSLQSGLRWIRQGVADLVLLDMTLPTYDIGPGEAGGSTHAFGGREFLREMRRFKVRVPVIIVTQFETFGSGPGMTTLAALDAELRRDYADIYCGAVYYHAAIESWKEQLREVMSKQGLCNPTNGKDSNS